MMRRRALVLLAPLLLQACASTELNRTDLSVEDPARFIVATLRNTGASAAARAGTTPREYGAISQYGVAVSGAAAMRAIARDYGLSPVRQWPIPQLDVHCIVFRIGEGQTQAQVLTRLQKDARVDSAQPLNQFAGYGQFAGYAAQYNDRYVGLQHSLSTMGVLQAHAWTRGKGVRIAVIDTAADLTHPDLDGRVKAKNLTGRRGGAGAHGTAVLGVIAAQANNEVGIAGVAPEAQVYSLAACWPDARDAGRAVCNTFTLASALSTAIDLHAAIVNLSLGGPSDPLLRRLVEYGLRRGVIFVCATPPDGSIGFPCDTPGVIAAGVAGADGPDHAALPAPGADVLTLTPNGGYDFLSGSSLAAANVSGAIALLLARERGLAADDVRDRLAQTAKSGVGINVCAALASEAAQVNCREAAAVGEPRTAAGAN